MSSQKLSVKIVILVQDIIMDAQTVYCLQSPNSGLKSRACNIATHAVYLAVVLKFKFISSHTNKDIARLPYGSREFHAISNAVVMILISNADFISVL